MPWLQLPTLSAVLVLLLLTCTTPSPAWALDGASGPVVPDKGSTAGPVVPGSTAGPVVPDKSSTAGPVVADKSSHTAAAASQHAAKGASKAGTHHHTRVTVTGVEVGAPPTAPSRSSSPTPTQPTAATEDDGEGNLIGDLISVASGEGNGTIAQVLDKALAKEFEQESKNAESGKGKTFNETVHSEEAQVETVVRISANHEHKDEHADSDADSKATEGAASSSTHSSSSSGGTAASKAGGSNSHAHHSSDGSSTAASGAGAGSSSSHAEKDVPALEKGVDRIIDSQDNEFVLSAPQKDSVATLTLDPLLIQDLTLLFASAALMGMLFESLKQPVINGYLVAGAIVGPGGLRLIKELVQVESLAQLGVQLLLFHLGRELSFSKLKSVWSVALVGGMLQIVAMSALGGVVAAALSSPITQGVFVGALLSMSSTSVVVKCLGSCRMNGTVFGQITIGTLILQDCAVGVMFALMPAFGAAASQAVENAAGGAATQHGALLQVALLVLTVMLKLLLLLAAALAIARAVLPPLLQLLVREASGELVQLSLVSLCLSAAWLCGRLGLSEELGAFIAGAMMAISEARLVAAGHLLPSSTPHSPESKGRQSAPDSPANGVSAAVLPKAAPSKHSNTAAVAYYRHATQRQQHQQQRAGAVQDTEAGDLVTAVHDTDSSSITAHLHDLHQQQQQSLLSRQLSGQRGGCGTTGEGHSPTFRTAGSVASSTDGNSPSLCASIESIQNVLTALFVASMGLIMSPVFLWHHASVLLCGTLVVTLLKAGVVTGVVRMFDVPMRLSLAIGLSMAHVGEFSFVLLSMANQLKLLSTQVYMLLLGVTAMSLLTTPFVIQASIHWLAKDYQHPLYSISGSRMRFGFDRE